MGLKLFIDCGLGLQKIKQIGYIEVCLLILLRFGLGCWTQFYLVRAIIFEKLKFMVSFSYLFSILSQILIVCCGYDWLMCLACLDICMCTWLMLDSDYKN